MKTRTCISLYLIFCILGAALEYVFGVYWDTIGQSPWVYGESLTRYTSLKVIPLWGFSGLVSISIYRAFIEKKPRYLFGTVVSLALATAWISAYSYAIA